MEFRWKDWNVDHIVRRGIDPEEAEDVVESARPPYPVEQAEEKFLVWGPGRGGRLLQVIFLLAKDATVYVIHARPMTEREKHRYRRRRA